MHFSYILKYYLRQLVPIRLKSIRFLLFRAACAAEAPKAVILELISS